MNETELLKILSDLSELKQKNELDTDERISNQERKWRNAVEYTVLESCAMHQNEVVRMDLLALLVTARKSTLNFTDAELKIIMLFLEYNLNERIEYVPYIKKALKRIKESVAVMRRKLIQEEKVRNYEKSTDNTSEEYIVELAESLKTSARICREIEVYNNFIRNLRNLCTSNLYPDAVYCRRKSSLQILCLMQEFLDQKFVDISWNCGQTEKIFNCLLLDTYESNKEMAYKILKPIDPTILGLNSESRVHEIINVAVELGNSIRPIDSVTAAYMLKISILAPQTQHVLSTYYNIDKYENAMEPVHLQLVTLLLRQLEKPLQLAKDNIVNAVTKHSLYGYLLCLKILLSECNFRNAGPDKQWQETIARLITMCLELNQSVSIIVNNSSPEGHLPMDLNPRNMPNVSPTEKEIVTPQMVLLCSWRTVKEVSLLFGLLSTILPIPNNNSIGTLLSEGQIIGIGEHLVTLLCETKHTGAFEQAYIGFSQLCTRLWRLNNNTLNQLPIIWLHQILLAITGLTAGNSKLCATRRSAGVPFLVKALVSSDPNITNSGEPSAFHSVMKILLSFVQLEDEIDLWKKVKEIMYRETVFSDLEILTEDEGVVELNYSSFEENHVEITEIKTHALNILRALFRHSQLADVVKPYVADGLIAAFKCYDGKTWAERNAATLLFSALIVRIFGVQRTKDHINLTTDNKMTGRIFFERYPSLLPFILDELQTFVSISHSLIKPNVHSILLLLSRLYFSHHLDEDKVNWEINEFVSLVTQCAKCRVYKTREMAARALTGLLTKMTAHDVLRKLFQTIATGSKNGSSFNLIHGCMLQILAIVRDFQGVNFETFRSDFFAFLDETTWILQSLENGRRGCFPLAAVYVDTLCELLKVDSGTFDLPSLPCILSALKKHLTEDTALQQGPGRDNYKISALKFVVSIAKCQKRFDKVCPVWNMPVRIYLHVLSAPETEVQATAWSTIVDIIDYASCPYEKKLLVNRAIDLGSDMITDLYKYNPDLQDAIFDFLYQCLAERSEAWGIDDLHEKLQICDIVFNRIRIDDDRNGYCERISFLRLLGKSYVTSHRDLTDVSTAKAYKVDVYKSFCNNDWIGTVLTDAQPSVFSILLDLFYICHNDQQHHCKLDWWTVVLQLLVHDNMGIRQETARLIRKINPSVGSTCFSATLQSFFATFYTLLAKYEPAVAMTALFYWSTSLIGDVDYERDETEVFNKCKNYDCFEPINISDMCINLTKVLTENYSIDNKLPVDCVRWINLRMSLGVSEVTSFRELIVSYKEYIPMLEKKLKDILDPMYKNKLQQVLVYEKFATLLNNEK